MAKRNAAPPGRYVRLPAAAFTAESDSENDEGNALAGKIRRIVHDSNQGTSSSCIEILPAAIPAGLALGLHALVCRAGLSGRPHSRKIVCELTSRFSKTPLARIELVVVQQVIDQHLPHTDMLPELIPKRIRAQLADPNVYKPAPVDAILGAGVWAIIVRDGLFTKKSGIAYQPSELGWMIYGGGVERCHHFIMGTNMSIESEKHMAELLQRLWELEVMLPARTRTLEQQQCEDFFVANYRRTEGGRHEVGIPLRSDCEQLGSSRAIALHRYHQLERRFQRDPELKLKYREAINEMINDGHMQLASRPPIGMCFHIPHHAVTTKFRVVFDASCTTDRNVSLNKVQLVGEKLQDDLHDIILRFRCHPVAVTADIKKMFLQVKVKPEQWDLQRVFWRAEDRGEIQEYWLTGVTFGMSSAPHCAVRAMIQGTIPDSIKSTIPDGRSGNTTRLLQFEFADTTVLGLRWLPKKDELMFKFRPPPILEAHAATKRRLLSHIMQIFDPNGYIGPVIITARILMQRLWRIQMKWDARVPDEIFREWQRFQEQLPAISQIRIPRWLGINSRQSVSLHGFSDASELVYGAVLFAQIETETQVESILIAAKARVAPLQTLTVPRLELCAAQLLSELVETFRRATGRRHVKATLWTDSAIVLAC